MKRYIKKQEKHAKRKYPHTFDTMATLVAQSPEMLRSFWIHENRTRSFQSVPKYRIHIGTRSVGGSPQGEHIGPTRPVRRTLLTLLRSVAFWSNTILQACGY